jgi:hypothetical protein
MRVLIFCKLCLEHSHSNTNSVELYHKCTSVFMWSGCYCCQILIDVETSRNFRKILIIWNFTNSIQWQPSRSMRTDGQTDVKQPTVTVAFCQTTKHGTQINDRKTIGEKIYAVPVQHKIPQTAQRNSTRYVVRIFWPWTEYNRNLHISPVNQLYRKQPAACCTDSTCIFVHPS